MPRRKNKNSRRGRKTQVSLTSDHVRVEAFSTLKTGVGATTFPINPAGLGSRITAIADLFEMYRVKRLRIRFHPVGSRTANSALCFVPGVTDTAPSSYINIVETQTHLVYGIASVMPSVWLNIGPSTLASYQNWYKTVVGTPDAAQEIQGNIYLNGAAVNDPYMLEVEGVIEFRAPVEAGATPQMRREKLIKDEYVRLQGVLTEGSRLLLQNLPSRALSGVTPGMA